jgi:hypothetical protein
MNVNLLNVVKRIIGEQGESILNEPKRLQPFLSDYASGEPKEDRVALGRAIENGFYTEIKKASASDRPKLKTSLVQRLQAITGFDAARCTSAVELLEAVTSSAAPAPVRNTAANSSTAASDRSKSKVSKRTLLFAIVAGAGALVGELVSNAIGLNSNEIIIDTYLKLILNVAFWAGLIGLGISVALLVTQTVYLKKKPDAGKIIKSALTGIAIGMAAGAIAQIFFSLTYRISDLMEIVSRIIGWGILGWGLGLGVSSYVPNFPKKRAMLAGLAGGIAGGAIFRALFILGDPYGRIIGVAIMGLIVGLAISWVEEALRQAWITVYWGPKESRAIALGDKPVIFGSSKEADIYVGNTLPVRAMISVAGGQVVFEDKANNRRNVMKNSEEASVEKLKIVVNTK